MYSLQFPTFTAFDYSTSMCDRDHAITNSIVYNWLTYGKLPESATVTPTYYQQAIGASSSNRYLTEVFVNPIPVTQASVSLAADAVFTITNSSIGVATSTNTAAATVEVSNGTLTITGVAAGTSTVTVFDSSNDTMFVITVTVA